MKRIDPPPSICDCRHNAIRLAASLVAVHADNELQRRVELFLDSVHFPGLRGVQVDVSGNTVRLSGQVGTFYEKQVATECCRRVAGVRTIVNVIDVAGASVQVETAVKS